MLVMVVFFRSEERFSRNAETDLVCRLLLEKKKKITRQDSRRSTPHLMQLSCLRALLLVSCSALFFSCSVDHRVLHSFPTRRSSDLSDKLVLTSVTPASSAPVLQTPKATSSTLYFDSLTVNAGNGGFLHCIQMDTSVNAANQVVSVGADIAFDADPK